MSFYIARAYYIYTCIIFGIVSIFFLCLQFFFVLSSKTHRIALSFNKYWSTAFLSLAFFRFKINYQYKPKKHEKFIVCSNHFSYFDIPSIYLTGMMMKSIGKNGLEKVPFFGFVFRKLHISMNRHDPKSKVNSILATKKNIRDGYSIMFFPEGGTRSTNYPKMIPFQNGAFKLAVELQLPILPIVLENNYKICPANSQLVLYNKKINITVLDPIYPKSKENDEITVLKNKTFDVIQNILDKTIEK